MMNIIEGLQEELPPFNDFMNNKFEKHNTKLVGSGTVYQFWELRKELFLPELEANWKQIGVPIFW